MTPPGLRAARSVAGRIRRRLRAARRRPPEPIPPRTVLPTGPVRVGIGPLNSAGQGWAWLRAAERHLDGVSGYVWALQTDGLTFPADYRVSTRLFWSRAWQREQAGFVRTHLTHVLAESFRPYLGTAHGTSIAADLPELARMGVAVGLVCHGSDIRSPATHREREPFSPFHGDLGGLTAKLEESTARHHRIAQAFDGPVFVSTPDLLDYAPHATWLPVVVDLEVWAPGPAPLQQPRPVVLHVPSNPLLKGSARIDEVLTDLDARGAISYLRAEGVPPERMPDLVRSADVLVDQVGMSLYGVQAAQAMATGRLVLAQVGPTIRARLPEPLPVLETDPDRLAETLDWVLSDPDAAREVAAAGPGFVARMHDGRTAAAALAGFLGVPAPEPA